ncbi:hypothetical protein G9C98_003228 [Cotesia typhae]|uniref:Uncharacterized protein n=1 Tax=Cotesia typhae TaxID=2053667 RepID=A0A8J5QTY7_9HYME|nr:hypothetical protein G9C98_003228 [Cotesia typhae]
MSNLSTLLTGYIGAKDLHAQELKHEKLDGVLGTNLGGGLSTGGGLTLHQELIMGMPGAGTGESSTRGSKSSPEERKRMSGKGSVIERGLSFAREFDIRANETFPRERAASILYLCTEGWRHQSRYGKERRRSLSRFY